MATARSGAALIGHGGARGALSLCGARGGTSVLVTAPDRTVAVSKRSHCLVQLAHASNEPKDTIPRRHGGPRRPLQDGTKWPRNGRNVTFQAHLATAAAGHHGGAGWCPWAHLMRARAD